MKNRMLLLLVAGAMALVGCGSDDNTSPLGPSAGEFESREVPEEF